MSFLSELNGIVTGLGLPVEVGVFSGKAPDEYAVITPLADTFELHADNIPQFDTQEARLSFFCKSNYLQRKRQLMSALLSADFTVTARLYVGYENDTGYHHYAIDVAKIYETEDF